VILDIDPDAPVQLFAQLRAQISTMMRRERCRRDRGCLQSGSSPPTSASQVEPWLGHTGSLSKQDWLPPAGGTGP
jgi:hypothetical protein